MPRCDRKIASRSDKRSLPAGADFDVTSGPASGNTDVAVSSYSIRNSAFRQAVSLRHSRRILCNFQASAPPFGRPHLDRLGSRDRAPCAREPRRPPALGQLWRPAPSTRRAILAPSVRRRLIPGNNCVRECVDNMGCERILSVAKGRAQTRTPAGQFKGPP